MLKENKIFIGIASYKDPLLYNTIKSCIENAKFTDDLVIAIVDQNSSSNKNTLTELVKGLNPNVVLRYLYIEETASLGVSWARSLLYTLFDHEEFILQIDAHTVFQKDWDETLINIYDSIIKDRFDKRVILSSYPPNFTYDIKTGEINTEGSPEGQMTITIQNRQGNELSDENPFVTMLSTFVEATHNKKGFHIAAGFFFTNGLFVEEVPYDPFLYFHGEENSLSYRSFTKGWDIYHPIKIPIYHRYRSEESGYDDEQLHWNTSNAEKRDITINFWDRSSERLKQLFYGDGMLNSIYGIGDKRSPEEFYRLSRIDYKNKKILD